MTTRVVGRTVDVDGRELDLIEFRVDRERIDVTSTLPRPDQNWDHRDSSGHYHAWSEGPDPYPTLIKQVDQHECDGEDCEGYDVVTYHCRACRALVTPGTTSGGVFREFEPGLETWRCRVRARLALGRTVSVIARVDDVLKFGMAVVTEVRGGTSDPPLGPESYETTLVGTSALGRRST